MKQKTSDNTVPAVEKALEILSAIAASDNGLTRSELAAMPGITPTTCYRILQSLRKYHWIEPVSGRRWDLSPEGSLPLLIKMHSIAPGWENAQEKLDQLALETGLAGKLSVREGDFQKTVLRGEAPGPFSINGKINCTFSLIEGSVGAALLADAEEAELDAAVEACTEDIPEKKDADLLKNAVKAVKKHGYALSIGTNRWRIGAMSVPIRNRQGEVTAALTLLGLPDDFEKKKEKLLAGILKKHAAEFMSTKHTKR